MKTPRTLTVAFLFVIFLSSRLQAATWHVNDDSPPPGDGTSWGTAFAKLQDALAAASAGDMILVAEGIYYPDEGGTAVDNDRNASFQLIDDVQIFGGFPDGGGTRNLATHRTILSGDIDQDDVDAPVGSNSYSVVTGSGTGTTAVLDGFTIARGLADGPSGDAFDGPTRAGGGVYNLSGSPTFKNCTFVNNSAGFGGGLFGKNSSSPVLINCLIAGNEAGFFGGGINNRDSSSPVLVNCTITANSAGSSGGGGGITNFSFCNPSLTNCIVWNNIESGDGTSPQASINDSGSSTTSSAFSLIENINPGGTNLDGTNSANGPEFLFPGDPSAAPTQEGDFRLEVGSPALNVGSDAANMEAKDLFGNPRIADGQIDLGAYEGAFAPIFFDTLHVDHQVLNPGNGSDWSQAFATLNDALNGAVSGQTILVAKGSYFPDEGGGASDGDRNASFRLIRGVIIQGGYPNGGGPRNLAANETILSGDIDQNDAGAPAGNNSYTVVNGSNTGPAAVLDGFTITAGLANANEGEFDDPVNAGGAIHINDGSPTILNCILRGNFALTGGAGMVIENSDPRFINCVVSGNKTPNFGGGFHNRSGSAPRFLNTTFSGNSAGSNGGAVNNFGARPVFTNCIVWNNEANGTTTTEGASINTGGSFDATYQFSLIENFPAEGTNFDGTNPANDPLLFVPVDPSTAPSNGGDLRLTSGSFALDIGDTTANPQTLDVAGNPRVDNLVIDLGAFEGATMAVDSDDDGLSDSFELANTDPSSETSLTPESNEDKDPFTAIEEFAFGLDPGVSNAISDAFSTAIIEVGLEDYLSITWNVNQAAIPFVDIVAEGSEDLGLINAWDEDETVPIMAPAGMGGARSDTPISSQLEDFLRLRVEKRVTQAN
ncbi:choice-of-anchor Q domain-containing protein [Haloferula sp.]|uniref:choice-of-anchor Q domain-containing protein n=1 Tax=Haloferula sp. TaxID=2497595 RepID=UPI003C76133B